eukprot:jgi/Galph1/2005/GphlegSOOS_G691.1
MMASEDTDQTQGEEENSPPSTVQLLLLRILFGILSKSGQVDEKLEEDFKKDFPTSTEFSFNRYFWWRIKRRLDMLGATPQSQLFYGLLAMLFGFTCASSITLVFGALSVLDPLIAGILAVLTEIYTRYYYQYSNPSYGLRLLNGFKVGLMMGLLIDAFKISS